MNHKYGFHVDRTGDDVFDAIRRIKPRVIKTLDHDVGFWRRVREIHPDLFLIGRLYVPNQEQDRFHRTCSWPGPPRSRLSSSIPRLPSSSASLSTAWYPTPPEFEIQHRGRRYLAQRAEHLDTGQVRVYHVPVGEWTNVAYTVDQGIATGKSLDTAQPGRVGGLAGQLDAIHHDLQRLMRHLGAS